MAGGPARLNEADLPPAFAARLRAAFGARGDAFLAGLPALVAACEARWGLAISAPFPGLSYNLVAPARLPDGGRAVLKLGAAPEEVAREAAALRAYDGRGCARLLGHDPELGALLVERLEPGRMLSELADDAAATAIAAGVMARLWRPPPPGHAFPAAADDFLDLVALRAAFGGGTGPFAPALVDLAEQMAAELAPGDGHAVLLHGDLHHFNILSARREGWLAIDPKGLVGERAYDVGALLRNPSPALHAWPDLPRVQARRVDQLVDALGLDRKRLLGWAVAGAVLSAWWDYEEAGSVRPEVLANAGVLVGLG